MARPRPTLSIDLPLFDFDSEHASLPRTPEQLAEQQSAIDPPPPPRAAPFRLKRRRVPVVPLDAMPFVLDADTVTPTIEMTEAVSTTSSPNLLPSASSDGFLMPLPTIQQLVAPKTPEPRSDRFTPSTSPVHEWSLINDSRHDKRPAFQRSGSIGSSFSDSSVSSCGSSSFSAPNNGSCTSPESVATDPFTEEEVGKNEKFMLSPELDSTQPKAKRVKRQRRTKWTNEMDHHLENTYIMYLRDPRVTPFKTLPGIPPPLGVCSRVASKARRTWSPNRAATPMSLDTILESMIPMREGSPDTIRPDSIGDKFSRHQPIWPSDAATRKRLRRLVKGKPQLSAHYQRLLRTRSPSPFTSSAPSRSSEPPSATFSGRDMKMSLITSTAPSMQPEGPLAQLSSDDTLQQEISAPSQSQRSSRSADWFSRIGRSQAHQKSLSLQSGLSLDLQNESAAYSLASPFDETSNRTHLLHSMTGTKSLGRSVLGGKARKIPSLDSPIEMSGAPTMPRSLKRRFKSDEEKPRRPGLVDVFGPMTEDTGIVRNRGFTLGAVRATDTLAKMSEPAPRPSSSSADFEMPEAPPIPDSSNLGPIGSRSAPRRLAEPIPRLGSPFMEMSGNNRLFNTFPRSYIPTSSNPQPFQERLRELAALNQHNRAN